MEQPLKMTPSPVRQLVLGSFALAYTRLDSNKVPMKLVGKNVAWSLPLELMLLEPKPLELLALIAVVERFLEANR